MILKMKKYKMILFIFVSLLLFGSWYYVFGQDHQDAPEKADLVMNWCQTKVG